ncbi:MAG: uroporphyrinogen-III C-methyltransferase [Peptococcaceae bacterium]|jgi:uroporphyrinogen III methyltransferase/synthase|nr:uroporphyrinogen-III C-methyltransferase [Peptococcaceae bacterium]
MKQGYVYLVGAGPGDPKLLTVKGTECIAKAEVLVYDRLVSKRLLDYAPPTCERIYVGKTPERHTLRQEEINAVLVAKGLQGKTVTRLKGGDPFVFGRGGEEAEALLNAGVPFEVVPGITSAVAAPAYAGIPVTHRDLTSSFIVVTGHEDPAKKETAIQWEHLAQTNATLIFLMGMENLEHIAAALIKNGKAGKTPTALIQWGTCPEQRTLTGELDSIARQAQAAGFTNPAVIIIGEVVRLREKLSWLEKKPLFGKKIIVTRARSQASVLSRRIEDLGGEAWEVPAIELQPPSEPQRLTEALQNIRQCHWLIFTSVNGVAYFFREWAKQGLDIRELAGIELVAIGPATKAALEEKNLRVSWVPDEYRAEKVAELLTGKVQAGQTVLLARAEEARAVLPEALRAMGAEVWDIPVYRTLLGETDRQELRRTLREKQIDAVTFTSSSTVRNFLTLLEGDPSLLREVKIFSIGPVTSQTARELGLTVYKEAAVYTIPGLVSALMEG